jgi:hypothetical protein
MLYNEKCDCEWRSRGPKMLTLRSICQDSDDNDLLCSNKAQRDEISHGKTAKAALSIVAEEPIVTRILRSVYASSVAKPANCR